MDVRRRERERDGERARSRGWVSRLLRKLNAYQFALMWLWIRFIFTPVKVWTVSSLTHYLSLSLNLDAIPHMLTYSLLSVIVLKYSFIDFYNRTSCSNIKILCLFSLHFVFVAYLGISLACSIVLLLQHSLSLSLSLSVSIDFNRFFSFCVLLFTYVRPFHSLHQSIWSTPACT